MSILTKFAEKQLNSCKDYASTFIIVFNVSLLTFVTVRLNYIWMAVPDDFGYKAESLVTSIGILSTILITSGVTLWGYEIY